MTEATENKGYVKGSLKQVPFPKVLSFVHDAQKSGVLAIARDKKKVHVHFLNGGIVYVTSSYFPGLSLGDFLLKEGKITLQVHDESLEAIQGTNLKQGTFLVEKNFLSPHDMIETLNRQVTEKLFWLFEWDDGDFYFKEGDIIQEELRLVTLEFQRLIYVGVRDYMPLNSLPIEFKGRKESILFRRPNINFRLDALGLGPIDTRILSFVNGNYTLRQIVALARLKKRAIYKILYGLYLTGVICFPEGLAALKSVPAERVQQTPSAASSVKDESFEIDIASDLIAQAVQSVDRIKETIQAQAEAHEQIELEQPAASGQPADSASSTLDELGFRLDEALSKEDAEEVEEQFGFDESSSDGFSEEEPASEDTFSFSEDPVEYEEEPEPEYEEEVEEDAGFFADLNDYSDPEEIKKQGIILLEEEHFENAAQFLQRALEMLPEDFDLYAYLGWAMYNSGGKTNESYSAAEDMVKQGMGPGKSKFQHFLYLGRLYSEQGQYEFAELHFIKALEINVDCAEAREQIKKIHAK
jgi:tetratricopeptide (TPR) repeat protein